MGKEIKSNLYTFACFLFTYWLVLLKGWNETKRVNLSLLESLEMLHEYVSSQNTVLYIILVCFSHQYLNYFKKPPPFHGYTSFSSCNFKKKIKKSLPFSLLISQLLNSSNQIYFLLVLKGVCFFVNMPNSLPLKIPAIFGKVDYLS